MLNSRIESPLVNGLLEGYQTYDAIAGMVTGGIIIISINKLKIDLTFAEKKTMIAKSGLIAMLGLLLIYAGLIYVGAQFNSEFSIEISRTELLSEIATATLGNIGSTFISVLVAIACFTTAVAIIVSTADFAKVFFNNSQKAYLIITIIACLMGVAVGQLNFHDIVEIAIPILLIIYPITIVLILLNAIKDRFASSKVFKYVV